MIDSSIPVSDRPEPTGMRLPVRFSPRLRGRVPIGIRLTPAACRGRFPAIMPIMAHRVCPIPDRAARRRCLRVSPGKGPEILIIRRHRLRENFHLRVSRLVQENPAMSYCAWNRVVRADAVGVHDTRNEMFGKGLIGSRFAGIEHRENSA